MLQLALDLRAVTGATYQTCKLPISKAAFFTSPDGLLVYQLVDNCKHRAIRKILELEVRQQQFTSFGKLFEHGLSVGFVDQVVIGVETRQQQKFEATLDVVLSQLELCLDFVDFLVLQRCMLDRVSVQKHLGIVQAELADASEEPRLQDHLYVQRVLHALKVFCWILHSHRLALFVLDVVLVDDVQQFAPDSKLLIRRKHKHLRDCDPGLGRLVVFLESCSIRNQFAVHVH